MAQITRTYRGLSKRAVRMYLTHLGGEEISEDVVTGDGWHVTLDAELVQVGPTLELTEITVTFEGEEEVLKDIVERFSRKAMRAGG